MTRDGDRPRRIRSTGEPARARPLERGGASQPQLVRDLLATYLDRSGLRAGVEAATVVEEWPELVGPGIAAVTRVQRIADGVLFVAVTTSAWMMELNLMKQELLRRANAGKKAGRIRQIVFVMDG
ncbi:MAG TPA: DUF721 domain-containing protein [Longimicrobiaceae bacterium]